MSISIEMRTTPQEGGTIEQIAQIAAEGFGRANDADNYRDTFEHVNSADHLQLATHNEQPVGFALYRRCLWQPSN